MSRQLTFDIVKRNERISSWSTHHRSRGTLAPRLYGQQMVDLCSLCNLGRPSRTGQHFRSPGSSSVKYNRPLLVAYRNGYDHYHRRGSR